MTEEKMRKRLYETLEQEDLSQLRFPFILDQSENDDSIFSYLTSDAETASKPFSQKDFLTHKVNKIKD